MTETKLIVLKENKDYQPTDEEIIAYGEFLGLKFPEDDKFKLLLKQALNAPLPPGWQVCQTDDQERNVVYRNKKSQQIQEAHPLEGYYLEKIMKLKSLTQNLHIETILQERQSWLRQSSQLYGPSRQSLDYSLRNQNQDFINQIDEQQSIYGEQQQKSGKGSIQSKKNVLVEKKCVKSGRVYHRRKKQKDLIKQMKEEVMNKNIELGWGYEDIKRKEYPKVETVEAKQKLDKIKEIVDNLDAKKLELQKLENQRKRKTSYLESLRLKLQMLQKKQQ